MGSPSTRASNFLAEISSMVCLSAECDCDCDDFLSKLRMPCGVNIEMMTKQMTTLLSIDLMLEHDNEGVAAGISHSLDALSLTLYHSRFRSLALALVLCHRARPNAFFRESFSLCRTSDSKLNDARIQTFARVSKN